MRFVDTDLIIRGRTSDDAVLDEVERLWDESAERYRAHFESIKTLLPTGIRHICENYYLHDAAILSMGREDNNFIIVLRLDAPPRDLLVLTYELAGEPTIDKEALPHDTCIKGPVEWQYDEVELAGSNSADCIQSILLSNGWEIRLPVRELQVQHVQPLIPASDSAVLAATG